jgi:predicted flap endonuclease-1-like 5' DNA nuclease
MIKKSYVKTKKQYKVTFEIPSEEVGKGRDVRVLANFNNWSWDAGLAMTNGKGTYKATAELPAGHYQFRYLIDGWDWKNDENAEAYTDSGYGTLNCCFALDAVAAPEKKKATAKKPTAKKAAPKKAAAKKPAAKKAAPKKATAKKADDLKKIEGIGPKIAGLLNEAGISTFAQLAKASPKKLADVLQAAGARFRLAKPDTWQEQAKLAAAGKDAELKKLQDELKGGVR